VRVSPPGPHMAFVLWTGVAETRPPKQEVAAAVDLTVSQPAFVPKVDKCVDYIAEASESMESSPVDVVGIPSPLPGNGQPMNHEGALDEREQTGDVKEETA